MPALVIDEETFVHSSDILTEIDRRWPTPSLTPQSPRAQAQCLAAQRVEVAIGCKVLNRMLDLGRPRSVAVAR